MGTAQVSGSRKGGVGDLDFMGSHRATELIAIDK
jgi:hypothetical protein